MLMRMFETGLDIVTLGLRKNGYGLSTLCSIFELLLLALVLLLALALALAFALALRAALLILASTISLSTILASHWPQPIFSNIQLFSISPDSNEDIIKRLCFDNDKLPNNGTCLIKWPVKWRIGKGPSFNKILAILFGVISFAVAIPSGEEVDNKNFSSFVEDFLLCFFFKVGTMVEVLFVGDWIKFEVAVGGGLGLEENEIFDKGNEEDVVLIGLFSKLLIFGTIGRWGDEILSSIRFPLSEDLWGSILMIDNCY